MGTGRAAGGTACTHQISNLQRQLLYLAVKVALQGGLES